MDYMKQVNIFFSLVEGEKYIDIGQKVAYNNKCDRTLCEMRKGWIGHYEKIYQ